MTFPTAISFRGIESSEMLCTDVLERVARLERYLDDVLACRVCVEADPPGGKRGQHYGVFIRVTMPCVELESGGKAIADPAHEDPFRTTEEAFDSLTHRVEDFVRRRCSTCTRYARPQPA